MKKRDGSFLVSISLTELIIMLFFILLLLAAYRMIKFQEKSEELAKLERDTTPQMAFDREMQSVLGDDWMELVREVAKDPELLRESGEVRKEVEQLRDRVAVMEQAMKADLAEVSKALASTPQDSLETVMARLEELGAQLEVLEEELPGLKQMLEESSIEDVVALAKEARELRGRVANLVRRCGIGLPPCWVADEETGKPEYIYIMTIYEDFILVQPAWPPHRESEVDAIPGAREFPGKTYEEAEFRLMAQPILDWSEARECRHFVFINDRAESKDSFKRKLLLIEDYFYKYLVREESSG